MILGLPVLGFLMFLSVVALIVVMVWDALLVNADVARWKKHQRRHPYPLRYRPPLGIERYFNPEKAKRFYVWSCACPLELIYYPDDPPAFIQK